MVAAKAQPYSVDIKKHWKDPVEFNHVVFCSWKDISYILGIDDDWDLIDLDDKPPLDISNEAFVELVDWAKDYTNRTGMCPQPEQMVETETSILKSMCEHWSAEKIIPQHLNLDQLVADLNSRCEQEVHRPELFGGAPPVPGVGLEFFISTPGVSFTIFPPFIGAYTELYYKVHDRLPEWNLEDLNGFDVIETIKFQQETLGRSIHINLEGWDSTREKFSAG